MDFTGFPPGRMTFTPMPNAFFSRLLPEIDNLEELKVTLHVFWRIAGKKGYPRLITERELAADDVLMVGLRGREDAPRVQLKRALAAAVKRGLLLHLTAELEGAVQELYLVNTARSREVVAALRGGTLELGQVVMDPETVALPDPEQPSIFKLYEENVGLITPLLAEELIDAERVYPANWIEDAFKQAVAYNKRHWTYIRKILERWAMEGKGHEKYSGSSQRATKAPARYRS